MFNVPLKSVLICATFAIGTLSGCSSNDDSDETTSAVDAPDAGMTSIDGIVTIDSANPVVEAIAALRMSLDANDALLALPVIDHQANASSVELDLRPTSVQLFGNPTLGTPLMQVNQLAGLDLPQKMLAWEKEDGTTSLAYNSADYLRQRHNIVGDAAADTALTTIANALNSLVTNAAGLTVEDMTGTEETDTAVSVGSSEGILTVTSTADMVTTYDTLVASIQSIEALRLVAEVNHTQNALNRELELNPTRLVIFGNPNAGTPLMQAVQSVGIDLPQKMLVYENAEGVVTIAYNDPVYVAARHGITGQDDRLGAISGLLAELAENAAGIN